MTTFFDNSPKGTIVPLDGEDYKIILSKEDISKGIETISNQIKNDYNSSSPPVLLFVLLGGMYFGVDLSKSLDAKGFAHTTDVIRLKKFKEDGKASKEIEVISLPLVSLKERDVIIIEDVIDTGETAFLLEQIIKDLMPNSIEFCALITRAENSFANVKYCILRDWVDPEWFVGYGMDKIVHVSKVDGGVEKDRGLADVYQKILKF